MNRTQFKKTTWHIEENGTVNKTHQKYPTSEAGTSDGIVIDAGYKTLGYF